MITVHLPERDKFSSGGTFSLCGKSKVTFTPNERIEDIFVNDEAVKRVNCEKCLRFAGVIASNPYPNGKGGEGMKTKIKHHGARYADCDLPRVITVVAVYPDRSGCVVFKESGCYMEAPMEGDPSASIGVQFRIVKNDGDYCIIEPVVAATGANEEGLITVQHDNAVTDEIRSGSGVLIGDHFSVVSIGDGDMRYLANGCYVKANGLKAYTRYVIVSVPSGGCYWHVREDNAMSAAHGTSTKNLIQHYGAQPTDDYEGHKYGSLTPVGVVFKVVARCDTRDYPIDVRVGRDRIESPTGDPSDSIGRSYRIISVSREHWGIEEVPNGTPSSITGKAESGHGAPTERSTNSTNESEHHMQGKVYTGVLVQTKTVQAGDGVSTGVQQSKVIYVGKEPFVAPSAAAAATILSSRAAREVKDLNFEDPSAPIEAQISQIGGAI